MGSTMMSFVLENLPNEWDKNCTYNESYILFDLDISDEYSKIAHLFLSTSSGIKYIKRVQNPFQYGRFKLRQEMLNNYRVETVYHIVHSADLDIALKFTCDYRRYVHQTQHSSAEKQPRFYTDVGTIRTLIESNKELVVLVLSKIAGVTHTQSDYFIEYVVEFN